jgi:FkbM family methyltransferase
MTLKQKARKYRRRLYEFFGWDRYSRPALNDLDRKLEKYLPYRDGFFIEAGANDGFAQSNTYYFEKLRGWSGILVEPIPELYEKCVNERGRSIVFNCALVPSDYEGQSVTMLYSNLMSLVKGAQKSEVMDIEHVRRGMEIQKEVKDTYEITVPARTLSSILDEVGVQEIDLLSLDVEGYELSVLRGLDLDRYRPKYMLVETNFRDEIEEHLSAQGYEAIDTFSHHDVLYRETG